MLPFFIQFSKSKKQLQLALYHIKKDIHTFLLPLTIRLFKGYRKLYKFLLYSFHKEG